MREKLKIFGTRLLQFVFHPLLVVCYAAIIVIECNVFPFAFVEFSIKRLVLFSFMLLLFIFPMLFIIVLNKQNYITSYSNFSNRDLKIVLTMISFSYLSTYWLLKTIEAPAILSMIPMVAMANIAGMAIINQKIKVDTYTLALSGLCTYFVFASTTYNSNLLTAITTTILALGIVNYTFIEQETSCLKSALTSCVAGIAITGISIFFYSITK